MIDRLRLTAAAKIQLTTLKRKTGITHYNGLCRHALCLSLSNPSQPPEEHYNFNGGVEIDWRTLTGNNEELYSNLLLTRLVSDGKEVNVESAKLILTQHVHRGLSYLLSSREDDLLVDIAQKSVDKITIA